MKKLIVLMAALMLNISLTFAATTTNWDSAAALKRVNTIGSKILKANGVKASIEFKVSNQEDINAYADLNKQIYVYKGLLEYVSNDEELAGVIAHEMGHIVNGHCAKQGVLNTGIATASSMVNANATAKAVGEKLATSKISRNDENEADITGADLMAKAGYNPLAMVSLLNKISGNYVDILQTHPSGEKRILYVYDYISYNYKDKVAKGFNSDSYKKAMTMLSPTLEKRKNSKKLMDKYNKEQEKLLAKKAKRTEKMQSSGSTVWEGYFNTLQLMAF